MKSRRKFAKIIKAFHPSLQSATYECKDAHEFIEKEKEATKMNNAKTDNYETVYYVSGSEEEKLFAHNNKDFLYEIEYHGNLIDISSKPNLENALKELFPNDTFEDYTKQDQVALKVLKGETSYSGVYYHKGHAKLKLEAVAGIKLLDKKENYDTGNIPSDSSKNLSEGAYTWLEKFMGSSGIGNPPKAVEKELKQFQSGSTVKVYRGMGWHIPELTKVKNFSNYPFKLNDSIKNSYTRPSSWTANLLIAESFAQDTGPLWIILEADVSSSDILIDTRVLPHSVLDKIYSGRQREVILNKGNYNCKIVKIGYKNEDNLSIGWENQDPNTWLTIESKFIELQNHLNSHLNSFETKKWSFGTPRQHYNGAVGITFGSSKFNENNSSVCLVNFYDGKFVFEQDLWKKASVKALSEKKFSNLDELLSFLNPSNIKTNFY